MNDKTLKILNDLQRGKISFKKSCKLLNKSKKEIDNLFDSEDYVFLPTIEDEKKLFELEKQNIYKLLNYKKYE